MSRSFFASVALVAAFAAPALVAPAPAQTVSITDVANSNTNGFSIFYSSVSVNSAGVVAFNAIRNPGVDGGAGIFTATDTSAFTAVALKNGPTFGDFGDYLGINSAGVVAFLAGRDAGAGGGSGIFTATDSTSFNTIALNSGPDFDGGFIDNSVSINNLGTVAFAARNSVGVSGIFAAFTGETTPMALLRTGDPLFGSSLSSFSLVNGLATTSDTIAFQYNLANGVSGVARIGITGAATAAPEPASVAFVLVSLPVFAAVVRRRSR